MAILTRPSPQQPEHPITILAMKYDELLKTSRQQAALAREMSNKARQMIHHAMGMRARPLRFDLP